MPVAWMTSRRDEYDVDEKRMPAVWMTSRRDEYDVNEDGGEAVGAKDDCKYDTARRSTSFMNCSRSTHRDSGKLYNTTRRDEYDVDEDGGQGDAGSVDDSKMRGVRWSRA